MMNNESLKNVTNTTDATSGQSLRVRVATRKAEIEAAIANPATDERTRGDLQSAASAVEGLLTGDLDRIPKVVAASLSAWLESNKHLGERHVSVPQPVTERREPRDIPEPPAVESE